MNLLTHEFEILGQIINAGLEANDSLMHDMVKYFPDIWPSPSRAENFIITIFKEGFIKRATLIKRIDKTSYYSAQILFYNELFETEFAIQMSISGGTLYVDSIAINGYICGG